MNRRSFLETLAKAAAAFAILPAATTYKRAWKRIPGRQIWTLGWQKIEVGRTLGDLEFRIMVDEAGWECVSKPDINEVGDVFVNSETNVHYVFNGNRFVRL